MKSIFFLFLSLLFIISNEIIFDGAQKCGEGYTKRCFATSAIRSRCFCFKSCKEGEKMECKPYHSSYTIILKHKCKCVTEN